MSGSGREQAAAEGERGAAAEASDDDDDEFEGQVLDGGEAGGGDQPGARMDDDAANEDEEDAADLRAEVDGEYGEIHMRPLRSPIAPSTDEFEDHCRTHIPFRNWCPVCVAARGTEDPHRTRDAGRVRPGTPTICIDYKELKKGQAGWVVVRDQKSRFTTANVVICKGPRDTWIIDRIVRDIQNMGYNRITLKGDGEPALVRLMDAIKLKRPEDTV